MSRQLSANTLLNFLGRRLMPLYVVHIFFIAATRVFLTRIIGTNSFAVMLPACLPDRGFRRPVNPASLCDALEQVCRTRLWICSGVIGRAAAVAGGAVLA